MSCLEEDGAEMVTDVEWKIKILYRILNLV